MSKKDFWKQDPDVVAKQLLGKVMVAGTVHATVLETAGYHRVQNYAGLYRPMLEMPPGQLYCPRHRNAILVLISTFDGGKPGACVLLRAVEVDGTIYKGPGRVSECLGVAYAKTIGNAEWVDDDTVWLRLDTSLYPVGKKPRGGNHSTLPDGFSEKDLWPFMQKIALRYLKEKPPQKFQEYLNQFLEKAGNVAGLRKLLP